MCLCRKGYAGKVCQIDINECSLNPCANGICIDLVNDYHCACYQYYQVNKLCLLLYYFV